MANDETEKTKVLPAHAGVILRRIIGLYIDDRITRTCGGDPRTIDE